MTAATTSPGPISRRTTSRRTTGHDLWRWYDNGGDRHVAAYLAELDLSAFDPKAPPPKTAAFWDIVDANRAPEDAELADVLDRIGNPDATTLSARLQMPTRDRRIPDWIKDRKNRRMIPYRLEKCGYVPVRNDAAETAYGRSTASARPSTPKPICQSADRIRAVRKLTESAARWDGGDGRSSQ